MEIVLGRYYGLPQVINKNIVNYNTVEDASVRQPVSLMNPSIIFNRGYDGIVNGNVNYITITYSGATYHYWINDWIVNEVGLVEVNLTMDVLMTYKDKIDNIEVSLNRSDQKSDKFKYVSDNQVPMSSVQYYEEEDFPFSISEDPIHGIYILTTAQSGYSPAGGGDPGGGGPGGGGTGGGTDGDDSGGDDSGGGIR